MAPVTLKSNFETFLSNIRPTATQRAAMRQGHRTLRDRLKKDENLSSLIVATFIQGSYRRATAIRTAEGERSDVDIVVVTRIPQTVSPAQAQDIFTDFMNKHYGGKWRKQDRSLGIEMTNVDLDLVITSAPSAVEETVVKSFSAADEIDLTDTFDERDYAGLDVPSSVLEQAKSAQWKENPLYIPNRAVSAWEPTHPIAQIVWTQAKNASTNGHYVNAVKALKWWKRNNADLNKHPKGYPLEHLIGHCCPDNVQSVAEGITYTLEAIVTQFSAYAVQGRVPELWDHGVPSHDVFKRISVEDFQVFMREVAKAASIARKALNADTEKASSEAWHELFGSHFPLSTNTAKASLLASAAAPNQSFKPERIAPKGSKGFA